MRLPRKQRCRRCGDTRSLTLYHVVVMAADLEPDDLDDGPQTISPGNVEIVDETGRRWINCGACGHSWPTRAEGLTVWGAP